jgi:hypothetical protein
MTSKTASCFERNIGCVVGIVDISARTDKSANNYMTIVIIASASPNYLKIT